MLHNIISGEEALRRSPATEDKSKWGQRERYKGMGLFKSWRKEIREKR